jgi:hypothetical protein
MGTGRKYNKDPLTRPKKAPIERRRREKVQRKRLIELGMSGSTVGKLNARELRQHLRQPAKVSP